MDTLFTRPIILMKKILYILLFLPLFVTAQTPAIYLEMEDANHLPSMKPSDAFIKVKKVYGADFQTTYFYKTGVPQGAASSFLASIHLNIISTYVDPVTGLPVTGYWTTEKVNQASANTIFFYKSKNRFVSLDEMYKLDSTRIALDSVRINSNTASIALKANASAISPVGFSGLYSELIGKPTIPAPQVQSDWNSVTSPSAILNKPTIPVQVSLTAGNKVSITGTYPNLTIAYIEPTITNTVTRSITGSTFTVSTTKQARVAYSVSMSCTATIGSAANGKLELQYSTNAGSTWTTVGAFGNSNAVTLAVVLNSVQVSTGQLVGEIPANALVRIQPTLSGVNAVASYITGQEIY